MATRTVRLAAPERAFGASSPPSDRLRCGGLSPLHVSERVPGVAVDLTFLSHGDMTMAGSRTGSTSPQNRPGSPGGQDSGPGMVDQVQGAMRNASETASELWDDAY